MCHGELRADEFEAGFGRPFASAYAHELKELEEPAADGLLTLGEAGSFSLSPLGRLLVRNVAMVFDAYLGEQRRGSRPLFSKTV